MCKRSYSSCWLPAYSALHYATATHLKSSSPVTCLRSHRHYDVYENRAAGVTIRAPKLDWQRWAGSSRPCNRQGPVMVPELSLVAPSKTVGGLLQALGMNEQQRRIDRQTHVYSRVNVSSPAPDLSAPSAPNACMRPAQCSSSSDPQAGTLRLAAHPLVCRTPEMN